MYQNIEDREIFRRFMNKEGCRKDMAINTFRANCLRQGVPEKFLVPEAWEVEHERVVGAGNKTMELTINQQLMEWREQFDPDPQRIILRDAVLALTDDAARAEELVPEERVKVTDSVHDAQLATARLMEGLPMAVKTGFNHEEYAETMMADMAMILMKAKKQGPDIKDIMGLSAMGAHVADHIKIIAKDKEEKETVKKLGTQLGKVMNEVKALFANLQKEMQKKKQQNGGGMDPKDAAKIQAMMMAAQVKAQNAKESHAQRTAQRKLQFQMELQQDQEKHQADIAAKDLEAAGKIKRNRLKALGDEE
jgi:phosphotransferase system HPr-like phosphotransfer protein